jgi:hypothetical protein
LPSPYISTAGAAVTRAGAFRAAGRRAAFLALGREAAALRAAFRTLLRTGFLPAFFTAARWTLFVALLLACFVLATTPSLGRLEAAEPDHTIASLSKGASPRVVVQPSAGGISIEIRPLVRTRAARWRIGFLAAAVLAAALTGGARLARVWETSLRRGAFEELPAAALLAMTLAVGVSTPLALAGLAALAFAEERIEVTAEQVSILSTAFERTRVEVIPREDLDAWVETYRPLPPWWTWAFRRLAARAGPRLVPIAGAAGHAEKRAIGLALARATGRTLFGVSGRPVTESGAAKIHR